MRSPLVVSLLSLIFLAQTTIAATRVVMNTNDSGPESLRQAMLDASSGACAAPCTIALTGISQSRPPQVIALQSPLPPVRVNGVKIQQSETENGFGPGRVEIRGAGAGASADGLRIEGAQDIVIVGLILRGFSRHGIVIDGATNVHLQACDFLENGTNGVLLFNAHKINILGCQTGNNGGNGIYARASDTLDFGSNGVGEMNDRSKPIPNGANGIHLAALARAVRSVPARHPSRSRRAVLPPRPARPAPPLP